MILPSIDEMSKSSDSWMRGFFTIMEALYAIVDYAVLDRGQEVQRWLFQKDYKWAGDPDKPLPFVGVNLYRLYIQTAPLNEKAMKALQSDAERFAAFLKYRDERIVGVQDLFLYEPEVLYLICMFVEASLQQSARIQDVDLSENISRNSIFALYSVSTQVRPLLEFLAPDIEQDRGDWKREYARTFAKRIDPSTHNFGGV